MAKVVGARSISCYSRRSAVRISVHLFAGDWQPSHDVTACRHIMRMRGSGSASEAQKYGLGFLRGPGRVLSVSRPSNVGKPRKMRGRRNPRSDQDAGE